MKSSLNRDFPALFEKFRECFLPFLPLNQEQLRHKQVFLRFLKSVHEHLLNEGRVFVKAQLVLFLTIRYFTPIKTVIQLCITS